MGTMEATSSYSFLACVNAALVKLWSSMGFLHTKNRND